MKPRARTASKSGAGFSSSSRATSVAQRHGDRLARYASHSAPSRNCVKRSRPLHRLLLRLDLQAARRRSAGARAATATPAKKMARTTSNDRLITSRTKGDASRNGSGGAPGGRHRRIRRSNSEGGSRAHGGMCEMARQRAWAAGLVAADANLRRPHRSRPEIVRPARVTGSRRRKRPAWTLAHVPVSLCGTDAPQCARPAGV